MRRLAPVMLFLFLAFTGCANPATGWTSTTRPYADGKATLNLLIMGDWGCAKPAQKEVADAIAKYIAWCEKGPPRSEVERFEVQDGDLVGYKGFEIY